MRILLFIFLTLISAMVFGSDCFDKPSTIERAQCHGDEVKELDIQLNLEYKDAIEELKKEGARITEEDFRKAQRLWVEFVEADCSNKADQFGGSGAWPTVEYQQCRIEYYKKRVRYFRITSGKEGR